MMHRAVKDYKIAPSRASYCYPFVSLDMATITDGLKGKFLAGYKHIVYSGALGEKQIPKILIEVFSRLLRKRLDICCHIFSRGPLFEQLKIQMIFPENLFFHDLVDEKNLYELYLRSDIQVIPQKSGTGDGAIPSKLPNILSAGVPVFAISDQESELSQIVKESGIGKNSDSWDISKIVDKLSDFIDSCRKVSHESRQKKVNSYINNNFSILKLIDKIVT